jgi:hypothetical protein
VGDPLFDSPGLIGRFTLHENRRAPVTFRAPDEYVITIRPRHSEGVRDNDVVVNHQSSSHNRHYGDTTAVTHDFPDSFDQMVFARFKPPFSPRFVHYHKAGVIRALVIFRARLLYIVA